MAWTSPEDVISRWLGNDVKPSDDELIIHIADLERQIKRVYPNIQVRIDSDLLDVEDIKFIVSRRIISFMKREQNPYTSESQSLGAFSRSVSYESGSSVDNQLTAGDIEYLAPIRNSGQAFSVLLGPRGIRKGYWYDNEITGLND